MIKNIAINLGSTSTKIAYYEDGKCKVRESISHDVNLLASIKNIWDQYDLRKATVDDFLRKNHIDLDDLDAISSRGGHTEPIMGGTYQINEAMLSQNRSGKYGIHVCNVGLQLAYEYAVHSKKAVPMTTDTPTTDELTPIARISGLAGIRRECRFQALNHRAMARYYAQTVGKRYEDLNLVVAMLGGGISVVAHCQGRMVDGPDSLTGEGPFSNNRAGTLPAGQVIKMCYSGRYTEEEMMYRINGEGGLISYLSTADIREIEKGVNNGNEKSRLILEAMCYQTSKEIGAMAAAMKGKIDAILLIGGMANSKFITDYIREHTEFLAPVVIIPGEREMESLCLSAYRVLIGEEPLLTFMPVAEE